MKNPKDLKYTKEHEWAKISQDIVTVGITHFAQEQLTDIVFVELPELGKNVTQFKPAAIVESVKSVSDVFAPVSGEVVEVNDELKDKPEIVNQDPYGKGWMLKIRIEDQNEIKNLMTDEEYDKYLKEKKH